MAAQNTYISLVCGVAVLVFCGSGVRCAPPCLAGDFDSQLRHILHTQMLSEKDPIITRVLDDVQASLDQRWQGYELILTGSLAAGLGTTASDIDLAVHLPNMNASANLYVLQETKKLFNKQPGLYSQVKILKTVNKMATILQVNHIPSKRTVDILAFDTGHYVDKRKLIEYYFQLDKRFQLLGVFLKYWFRINDLTGHDRDYLSGYTLYLLIIFYLQQKNMAPPSYMLHVNSRTHYIDDWSLSFNELPYSATNKENLYQLVGGFFKYYSEFNFEEYIVSPFTGYPIPKNTFTNVEKFSKEYTSFNKLNHTMLLAMKKQFDTEMSVQDVLAYEQNTAYLISQEQAMKFRYLMKSVATMFEELPNDIILSALLIADEHKGTVINHNNATEVGINEQNCIEIANSDAMMNHT